MTFKPDLIFISAGFDAHKKDTINSGDTFSSVLFSPPFYFFPTSFLPSIFSFLPSHPPLCFLPVLPNAAIPSFSKGHPPSANSLIPLSTPLSTMRLQLLALLLCTSQSSLLPHTHSPLYLSISCFLSLTSLNTVFSHYSSFNTSRVPTACTSHFTSSLAHFSSPLLTSFSLLFSSLPSHFSSPFLL
jgi:hypothetical protein